MKQRKGFVSNSSSCNFVIATKNDKKKLGLKINVEADLNDFVQETLKTEKEVIAYFTEEWSCDGDDPEYVKALAAVKAGKTVYILEAGDEEGNPIETLLCELGLNDAKVKIDKSIEIIRGEGGY